MSFWALFGYNWFMPKQKKTKKAAFTLVELIIVMVITMFLITMVLQSAFGSTAQLKFINSSNKVVDLIRQARSLAISGKAQPDYTDFNNDKNINDLVTPAGYGVYFAKHDENSPDEVIIFMDNHNKGSGAEGVYNYQMNDPMFYTKGADMILEKYTLPDGIKLVGPKDALPLDVNQMGSATVIYTPIFADVILNNINDPRTFTFGLSQQSGAVTRTACFQINKVSGLPTPTDENKCNPT